MKGFDMDPKIWLSVNYFWDDDVMKLHLCVKISLDKTYIGNLLSHTCYLGKVKISNGCHSQAKRWTGSHCQETTFHTYSIQRFNQVWVSYCRASKISQ